MNEKGEQKKENFTRQADQRKNFGALGDFSNTRHQRSFARGLTLCQQRTLYNLSDLSSEQT